MSSYSLPNCAEIYKELHSDLEKDQLYWIKNEAKIKAVVTSKNYDEFKSVL